MKECRDLFQMNEFGTNWAVNPCPKCKTKRGPRYQCRNLPSIGFFEGWVCDNCGHRERV